MLVHSAWGDAQYLRNLAVGLAAADPKQHFGFALGQAMALGQQFFVGAFQRFGQAEMPLLALGGHRGEFDPAIGKILLHPRLAHRQPLQLAGQRRWQLPAHRHAKAAIKNGGAFRRGPQHPPFAIQGQQRPVAGIQRALGAGGDASIAQMHL